MASNDQVKCREREGVRRLKELQLYEGSVVSVPANFQARSPQSRPLQLTTAWKHLRCSATLPATFAISTTAWSTNTQLNPRTSYQ